jgi:hypothetical protein
MNPVTALKIGDQAALQHLADPDHVSEASFV